LYVVIDFCRPSFTQTYNDQLNQLPGEVRNAVYDLVLPNDDRDVYIVKKISDLPQFPTFKVHANIGIEASSRFYHGKILVFDPTGISGRTTAVRENVRDTLHQLGTMLTLHQVRSTTLILNGNIWRYFAELYPLAELVRYFDATCYIDGEQYQHLGMMGAHQNLNRLNIVMS